MHRPTVHLLNSVILANDFEALRTWYKEMLGLSEKPRRDGAGYHYVELTNGREHVLGIASAEQMGIDLSSPRKNSAIPQLCVPDVAELFERIAANGGKILFGPSVDEAFGGYTYGGFTDPEGNQVWVVDSIRFLEV